MAALEKQFMVADMSPDKYKVSVVVPIYNVEDYLEDCLDSLVIQSLNNIEVIMVNDGSTDKSGEIALEYSLKYSNFKLVSQKNSGLSSARNTGIALAQGEFIYFLDSDDYLEKDALKILYYCSIKNKLDVLKFSAYTFHDKENDFKWNHTDGYRYLKKYSKIYSGIKLFLNTEVNGDHYASSCLIFIKRKLLIDNELKFIDGIVNEDEMFYFELMLVAKRASIINIPLYFRRYRKGSIMQADDYLNKNRSLCKGILKIHTFTKQHLTDDYEVCKIEFLLLINAMRKNWEKMPTKDQKSYISKVTFNKVKPFAKKYRYGYSIPLWLFFINASWYKFFRNIKMFIRKVF